MKSVTNEFPLGASSKTGTICFYNIVASCGWFLKRGGSLGYNMQKSMIKVNFHITLNSRLFLKNQKLVTEKRNENHQS